MKKKPPKKSDTTPEYDPQREQNVLLERIEKKVDAIGEGHIGLDRKIDKTNERLDVIEDTLQIISGKLSEHSSKLSEHDKRFDRVESAITENSKYIQLLKADVTQLNIGQQRIEQKLDIVTQDHEQRIQKLETVH